MNIPPSLPTNSNEPVALLPSAVVPVRWHVFAILIALAGGIFGILGAAYTELFHGSLLAAYVGAPIIEEALKPSGFDLLLAKWPRVLRGRLYTAMLAVQGVLLSAVIENVVYLNVYIAEPSAQIILWRYTVGLGLHTICSFIFGFGINWQLAASVRGQRKLLSSGKRFFFTAMALHSLYNITVTVFASKLGF